MPFHDRVSARAFAQDVTAQPRHNRCRGQARANDEEIAFERDEPMLRSVMRTFKTLWRVRDGGSSAQAKPV